MFPASTLNNDLWGRDLVELTGGDIIALNNIECDGTISAAAMTVAGNDVGYGLNFLNTALFANNIRLDDLEILNDQTAADVDSVHTFGRVKIGYCGFTDGAAFAHRDALTATAFAMYASPGLTVFNSGATLKFSVSNYEKMRISPLGRVGIGTTNPQAQLHISGSTSGTITQDGSNGGRLLSWDGLFNTNFDNSISSASIYATGNAVFNSVSVGFGITFSSDQRIKTDIQDIDDTEALAALRRIRPKTYYYKDKTRGTSKEIGFIAQEVAEDLPEAHTLSRKKIPNFYQWAAVSNIVKEDDIIISATLTYESAPDIEYNHGEIAPELSVFTDSTTDDSLMNIQSADLVNKVLQVTGHIQNLVPDAEGAKKCFIYGQQVDNFHGIKKDYIYTITTAATQRLDRELQAEREDGGSYGRAGCLNGESCRPRVG